MRHFENGAMLAIDCNAQFGNPLKLLRRKPKARKIGVGGTIYYITGVFIECNFPDQSQPQMTFKFKHGILKLILFRYKF